MRESSRRKVVVRAADSQSGSTLSTPTRLRARTVFRHSNNHLPASARRTLHFLTHVVGNHPAGLCLFAVAAFIPRPLIISLMEANLERVLLAIQ